MDEYTKKTKEWLDSRFKRTDADGVYQSHAPIYGFSKSIRLDIYKCTYAILEEIERLMREIMINNFLEVGCAEGYTAHLIRDIFGIEAKVTDLSSEAVKRAKEIYGLDGFQADVQSLDMIEDNSFDLVICAETIEHVPDPDKAFSELKRITKKALIVTVPAAKTRREKGRFIPQDEPHAHLNIFTKDELKAQFWEETKTIRGVLFKYFSKIDLLFTKHDLVDFRNKPLIMICLYKVLRTLFMPIRIFYGRTLARWLIKIDCSLSSLFPSMTYLYLMTFKKSGFESSYTKERRIRNILGYMIEERDVEAHILSH